MVNYMLLKTPQKQNQYSADKLSAVYVLCFIGIAGYILSILFNGFLRHIGLTVSFVQNIRIYLPEFFFLFVIFAWFISNSRLNKEDLVIWILLAIEIVIGLITYYNIYSLLALTRDLIEPFLILGIMSKINLSEVQKQKLLKLIRNIMTLFTVIGLQFSIYQRSIGWQGISKYFAGYSFFGVNDKESLRVINGWLGLRSLGTTGSSETFGFYSGLAIIIFLCYGFKNKKLNFALITISIMNILLSGLKTPLVSCAIILFLAVTYKKGYKSGWIRIIFACGLGLTVTIYTINSRGTWEDSSLYQRLILWSELFRAEHLVNIIAPVNILKYSSGTDSTGIISFWDNSFFYILFSTGIYGFIAIIHRFKVLYQRACEAAVKYIIIYMALSGITTCIFFGRNFISVAMIVLGLTINSERVGTKDEKRIHNASK